MATICDCIGCGQIAQRRSISFDLIDKNDGQFVHPPFFEFDGDLCQDHAQIIVRTIRGLLEGRQVFVSDAPDPDEPATPKRKVEGGPPPGSEALKSKAVA